MKDTRSQSRPFSVFLVFNPRASDDFIKEYCFDVSKFGVTQNPERIEERTAHTNT